MRLRHGSSGHSLKAAKKDVNPGWNTGRTGGGGKKDSRGDVTAKGREGKRENGDSAPSSRTPQAATPSEAVTSLA